MLVLIGMPILLRSADESLWPDGKIPNYHMNQCHAFLRWHEPRTRQTDAVLIAVSGGGYSGCGVDGFEVAGIRDFALAKGMTVVTMRYRCPRPKGCAKHLTAWQDAQRTVRLVRAGAKRRGLNPENIGFTGCSAGGHLAMMVAVSSQTPAYAPVDEVDRLPCHVNWAVPVYPAYLLKDGADHHNANQGNDLSDELVPELSFDLATPPMCFFHGDEDLWSAMGSVRAYHKLRTMGIPGELHVMALENHCFQSNPRNGTPAETWKDRVWEWLVSMDFVTGHPQVWRKEWTDILPLLGEACAETGSGSWGLTGWNKTVLETKRRSPLWLKGSYEAFLVDFEYRVDKGTVANLLLSAASSATGNCSAVRLNLDESSWGAGGVHGRWNRLTARCQNGHWTDVIVNGCDRMLPTPTEHEVKTGPVRLGFEADSGFRVRRIKISKQEIGGAK